MNKNKRIAKKVWTAVFVVSMIITSRSSVLATGVEAVSTDE